MSAMLSVVTDPRVARSATLELRRQLKREAGRGVTKLIGFPGGHDDALVHAVRSFGVWGCWQDFENRFWNGFGIGGIDQAHGLQLVAEINIPRRGIKRSIGGVLVRDGASEKVLLCHRGKIGGGRRGVGKNAFWERFPGEVIRVRDGDRETDVAVIAEIPSRTLGRDVATFVKQVSAIKQRVVAADGNGTAATKLKHGRFSPEFTGKFHYSRAGAVRGVREHGVVVNELRRALKKKGFVTGNDRQRDLYLASRAGKLHVLFEVKTDVSTTSLHTGVGQLMLHGAATQPDAILVLAVPSGLSAGLTEQLGALRVRMLSYALHGTRCDFPRLDRLLGAQRPSGDSRRRGH